MDFSDPQHPKVAREFAGVTAITTDDGLIFLANADGIWILHQTLAEDPEVEKATLIRSSISDGSGYKDARCGLGH